MASCVHERLSLVPEKMVLIRVSVLLIMCAVPAWAGEPVHIPDAALKAAVEEELWVLNPTARDMLALTSLQLRSKPIKDLTGLEYAVNLVSLKSRFTELTDISPLAGLTGLKALDLSQNTIADLSPLSRLTNLVNLNLHGNDFSDITPLAGLHNLESLVLLKNRVSDISALAGLTRLEHLDIQLNHGITDISALANMTELTRIGLHYNRISDVAALSGLPKVREINLRANEVSDISPLLDLPNLAELDLRDNSLNNAAYCSDLSRLEQERPGIRVQYSPRNTPPNAVQASDGTYANRVRITWSPVCNGPHYTSHYRVLRQKSGDSGPTVISNWSPDLSVDDLTADAGIEYSYRVQMSPFSNGADAGDYRRTRGWRAARPQAAQRTLYVDDDGDLDPGPLTPSLSDPLEDGSPQHPFDRIQEAIDAALDGDLVFVRSGTYWETLIVANKDVTITGIDPDDPNTQHPFPVIDANSLGTAVSFVNSPEGGGELTGFIVTGGADDLAGAIYCDRSHPVISHCVIVGHQVVDDGALSGTVFCVDSNAVITNCTIANNLAGPITAIGSHVTVANCIIWDNGPNELVAAGAGSLSVRYSNVNRTGFPATDSATEGPGNTQLQPLFVQPGRWADGAWIPGDYHLHSQIGRWDPKGRAWVQDQVTSPCINAGDSGASVAPEPLPNGGIVNMGAYGATSHASKRDSVENHTLDNYPVYFRDATLKAAVESELSILDPTPRDMLGLTSLFSVSQAITDITGLEYATNLEALWVRFSELTKISPLQGLTRLRSLNLSQNSISDLSPLRRLKNLIRLNLHGNDIDDITPLAGLNNLQTLVLLKNVVVDIAPLAGLTKLEHLDIQLNHRITDISALANMTELTRIGLHYNRISDVSALSGLPKLREINLRANAVSDISPLLDLPSLAELDLRDNPLNNAAYCSDLSRLERERPGIRVQYSPRNTPPNAVQASDGTYANRVRITWSPVCNGPFYPGYYRVFRKTDGDSDYSPLSPWQPEFSFDDVTAQPEIRYSYRVQASPFSNGAGAGDYSSWNTGWRRSGL